MRMAFTSRLWIEANFTDNLMKLFGQLIRTVVNVATLPVSVAKDAINICDSDREVGESTKRHIDSIKEEAQEDSED